MKSIRMIFILSAFFLMITVSGCSASSTPVSPTQDMAPVEFEPSQAAQPAPTLSPTQTPRPTATLTAQGGSQEPVFIDFDPGKFGTSTLIDNKWSPMRPGMHWTYEGTIVEEGQIIPHRIEFTVTDLVKEIAGVRTVVAWSVDYTGGKLVEKEIAFYAQDDEGRVWYLGEYPEEYENDTFVKAPAWIAGIEGARAGVKMQADPQLAAPNVYQGWGPAVEWSDFGHVDQMGLDICVPVNCYKDVLVVAESSLDETGAFQLKYFAPDVGEIQVGWAGADLRQEELVLTGFEVLGPAAMAEIHAQTLDLEKHGFEISKDVYAQTEPAEAMK